MLPPLDSYVAVEPVFSGEAYITGMQQFAVDPDDPVKYGFKPGSPPVSLSPRRPP